MKSIILSFFVLLLFSCKEDISLNSKDEVELMEPIISSYLPTTVAGKGARIVNRKPNGILVKTSASELKLFPFLNQTFYGHSAGTVGTNWIYGKTFAADWNNDGSTDLVGRDGAGNLYFAPYKNGMYVKQEGDVGNGFNVGTYLIGEWASPSGTDPNTPDLMGIDNSGNVTIYPFSHYSNFRTGTFKNGSSINAGNISTNYTHYFVADWSGDGLSDMICRDVNGNMDYYVFANNQLTYKTIVGHGWFFTNFSIGDSNQDGIADNMMVVDNLGNLKYFPFLNQTFYGNGGGTIIGTGFNFSNYFFGAWDNANTSRNLIGRTTNGEMYYQISITQRRPLNGYYSTPSLVGHGWNFNEYFTGTW